MPAPITAGGRDVEKQKLRQALIKVCKSDGQGSKPQSHHKVSKVPSAGLSLSSLRKFHKDYVANPLLSCA